MLAERSGEAVQSGFALLGGAHANFDAFQRW